MNKKEKECKHQFVKYPPKIGKLKVCTKCGFLWVLGDVKFGEHTIKLSGSGNYIESSTTTAPTNPISGKIRLYATSGTSLRMRDSTGTETDLAAPGTLYNFLTNPGFEILQRGAGPFTANNAYAHDRWQLDLGGTSTISVTDETTIVDTGSQHALKAVYTHNSESLVKQVLKNADLGAWSLRGRTIIFRLRARTATASALRASISYDGTGATRVYSSYHTGGSTFESLDVTATVPTDATYVQIEADFVASCTAYLDNATLVIGSTAQTYYPLHPAEEWERCQRYYEAQGGANDNLTLRTYAGTASSPVFFSQRFMTRKAVVPTLTLSGTWGTTSMSVGASAPTIDGYRLGGTSTATGNAGFWTDSADDLVSAEANP